MKKAGIVSIGNELLDGQVLDTNAAYLSRQLFSVGIPTVGFYVVPDDIDSIVRALNLAGEGADVVLVTGGLGPTDDDLTRQAFAKFLHTELVLQNNILRQIQDFFICRNLPMPENNKIQAYIPKGAEAIVNSFGTAPGIMTEFKGKLFVAMPGVPAEMEQMFAESVLPKLKELATGQAVVVRRLKCFGAGESAIVEKIGPVMQRGRNPLVNCTVENGVITLHIIATAQNRDEAQRMAEKNEKMLADSLGKMVYGTGQQSLAEVAGEKLTRQKKTIAVAESCTGGTLAKLLTDVPGASRYFTRGWVTYSNEAKIDELGVPAGVIEKYGAVSEQVSQIMAQNARKKARTDFAIGITGIAGPTGNSEQKPIGLVYISVDSGSGCETRRFIFSHNRDSVRFRAAQTALNMLRLKL